MKEDLKQGQPDPADTEVKTDDQSASTGEVDYAAEYAALLAENERIARDRDNYRAIGLAKKGKGKAEDGVQDDDSKDEDASVDAIAEKVAEKLLPTIQRQTASDTIQSVLNELSSDPNEQKLIMYHFENSVGSNGNIRGRLENAKLIANKKAILKTNQELKVALHNRSQLGNTGQGASTEQGKQGDTYFTPDQLAFFKKRGLDPEKVKANIVKHKS